ncbi:MAG: MBOAT family protein [Oscillospiraceae bacterium]|nr:MBOAT family protein [Oscillospiraceae bacterium]
MVFSSALFLFAFLPAAFLGHLLIGDMRAKNIFLLCASLLFYAAGEPIYIFLMLLSIAMNYAFGRLIDSKRARSFLALSVICNLLILAVFKYADLLIETVDLIPGVGLRPLGLPLPIGISFFTFQAMSYLIDIYRGRTACQKNILDLALYISLFPQLIAGPIVQYADVADQIEHRTQTAGDIADGLRRFIAGLAKKLLIANTLGKAADAVFAMDGGVAAAAWAGAIFYCLQIYFDFSGYSDMAIGLGRMFGFRFRENFDYPYAAVSLRDFWRRWHISLSSWFREYLYIPLGGSRRGEGRAVLNRLIVFFLTGLWHGASYNFVIWGMIHGAASTCENLVTRRVRVPRAVTRIFMLLVVIVSFVFFRADTLGSAAAYIAAMFTRFTFSGPEMQAFLALLDPWLLFIAGLGVVLCLPVRRLISLEKPAARYASYGLSFLLLLVCIGSLASSGYNPFIYFRF